MKNNDVFIIFMVAPRDEKDLNILNSIYNSYQTALKMFYDYAKEKELYKFVERELIEKKMLKIIHKVKKETGLFTPSLVRAERDIVTSIMEWMEPCKKVKKKKVRFYKKKCNFNNYPELKEAPAILYYSDGYSLDNFEHDETPHFVRIRKARIPVKIDEEQLEILRKAIVMHQNMLQKEKNLFGIAKLVKDDDKWYLHVQINI